MTSETRRGMAVVALGVFAALVGWLVLGTPMSTWLPMLWLFTGTVILVWWAHYIASEGDAVYLVTGVLVGMVIRASFAWMIYDNPLRGSDGIMYWMIGGRLELLLTTPRSLEIDPVRAIGTATGMFYYLHIALHSWILHNTILVHVSNGLVGAANGLLVYLLGRLVWNRKVGVVAAWLAWTMPIYFIHDTQNFRDTFALFGLLLSVYGAQLSKDRWTLAGVVHLLLGLGLLLQVRNYIAIGLLGVFSMGLMVTRRRGRLKIFVVLFGLASVLVVLVAQTTAKILFGKLAEGSSMLDLLLAGHQGLADLQSRSSAFYGTALSSPLDLVTFLPKGIVHSLLTPLPWNATTWQHHVLMPEVIIRYVLLPFVAIGFIDSLKHHFRRTFMPLAVMTAVLVLYSVLELGGNYRHNLQFFPFLHMLAAYGIIVAARWRFEVVMATAILSLGIWAYGLEAPMFAVKYFAALLTALGTFAVIVIHMETRDRTMGAGR